MTTRNNVATLHTGATPTPRTTLIVEPGMPTIIVQRTFNAPRRLLWEAATRPEHLSRWFGPRNSTMPVCEIDFRAGGKYRFVLRSPDGREDPFIGEFEHIAAPERLVQTFIYDVDGIREHPAIETMVFSEHDGKTTWTTIIVQDSVAARDGMVASGMEPGMAETHARLDELLASLQRTAA